MKIIKRNMSEAAINARRMYQRDWRAKNPERVKEIQRRYWEKKASKTSVEVKGKTDEV